MKSVLRVLCMAALVATVPVFFYASAPAGEESKPVTGAWNIILTPLDASGNPGGTGVSLQMSLEESGSMVYATCCGGVRLFGNRDGKKLHLQFLSHGATDRDSKAGGIEAAGGMDLKVKDNNTLQGEAVVITPGEGEGAFTRFAVTANKGPGGAGWSPRDICNDLNLGAIVTFLFGDLTDGVFAPMDACDANKNGGGFYVFGDVGPGSVLRPYATTTVYVPVELSGCPVYRSSRDYSFSVYSGGEIATVEKLEETLGAAGKFLAMFHVDAQTFIQHVDAIFAEVPQFALTIGASTNNYSVTLYINLGSNVPEDACSKIENSDLVRDIKEAFDLGHGFSVKCGHRLSDSYDLKRQIVPSFQAPLDCTSPVLFMYILGTIEVHYD